MNESTNEYYSSNSKNENNLWKISSKSAGQKVQIKTSVRKMIRGFWKKSKETDDENSEIVVDGSLIEFWREFLIIVYP